SGDRDERKQHSLADLDDPGMPLAGPAVTVSLLSPLMRRLAVFMQLLAGLDRVQSLGHQRTPAPPGKPCRHWRLELRRSFMTRPLRGCSGRLLSRQPLWQGNRAITL